MRSVTNSVAVLVVAAYLALHVYGLFQMRRARSLARSLEELSVGSVPAKRQLEEAFPDLHCELDRRCYSEASNLPFSSLFGAQRGLRPPAITPSDWWFVAAQFGLDAKGKVLDKEFGVDDGKYYQFATIGISVREDDSHRLDPCANPGLGTYLGYFPQREKRSGALIVDLSPNAQQIFNQHAFDLHLGCLNTYWGCRTPGDIAPLAWRDALAKPDLQEVLKHCNFPERLPTPGTK